MKHIKMFEDFDFLKKIFKKKDHNIPNLEEEKSPIEPHRLGEIRRSKYDIEIERRENNVFAIMTKELSDRKKNQRHTSMAHDAYHYEYNGIEELEELERKYPIGGEYNGETITRTCTLNKNNLYQ